MERQDPPPARPKDEGDTIDPDDLRRALSSRSLTKSMTFKVRDAEKEAEIDDAPFEDLVRLVGGRWEGWWLTGVPRGASSRAVGGGAG